MKYKSVITMFLLIFLVSFGTTMLFHIASILYALESALAMTVYTAVTILVGYCIYQLVREQLKG